jgi:hypothetical protein
MSRLPPGETRCADALTHGCPDRRNCARWVDRMTGNPVVATWRNYAETRTDRGCRDIIRIQRAPGA